MTSAGGRTRSRDLTRVLLDAALRVLTEDGPEQVTVRRVAQSAGVAPMGVYSRFGGKDGLLEALVVEGFTGLREAVVSARGADATARLRAACAAYRSFALAHPRHYRLMFAQLPRLALGDAARAAAGSAFDELVARVEDATRAGALGDTPPVLVAQELWAAAHGAVILEIDGLARADPAAAYAGMVNALLRGLGRSDVHAASSD